MKWKGKKGLVVATRGEFGDFSELAGARSWGEVTERIAELLCRGSQNLAGLRKALNEGNVEDVLKHASVACGFNPSIVRQRVNLRGHRRNAPLSRKAR